MPYYKRTHVTPFAFLEPGDHFKFLRKRKGVGVAKKVSDRCYEYPWGRKLVRGCVRSIKVGVDPVGRSSPVRKR